MPRTNRFKPFIAPILILVLSVSIFNGSASGINWRQASGEKIKLLFVSHPFVDSVRPLIPEFEKKTGIKVDLEVLAEVPAFDKLLMDLQSKSGTYDVFMTDPLHNWQYASAGWVEPLDPYIKNSKLTDAAAYNVRDFSPGLFAAGRWNCVPLQGIGKGSLWALPINYETYILAYRADIFKENGLKPPKTYDEMLSVVKKLKPTLDSRQMYGVTTRFEKYWDLSFLTYGTIVLSYGGQFMDKNGKVVIASPQVVAATEKFIEILKAGAPDSIANNSWYDSMQQFASGRYAMAFNEADLFAPIYEDKAKSTVAGKVGYALPPAGPKGLRRSGIWLWQLSMNKASSHKKAAWLFINWVTSKDTMVETHLRGNMNPVRISAWEDPRLQKMVEGWGETPGQYRDVEVTMLKQVAGLYFPPHPELTRMLDRWAEAVQQSFFDGGNVRKNLEKAAKDIEGMLK
jgi:multiple sugar transport system substrate-binding protein